MKKQTKDTTPEEKLTAREKKDIQEHLIYPPGEDIYSNARELGSMDVDDLTQKKSPAEKGEFEKRNEKDFKDDISGDDLDVPGSELDDVEEGNGNEDEENNYYSLGDTK